jgi:zinc transport system substrate-binding protein
MKRVLAAMLAIFLPALGSAEAAPRVVASIMPVHSIVAAVMGDVGRPDLLFTGRLSEHTASLNPAQVEALGQADLVFMVSRSLEFKLGEIDGSEAVNGKHFVELALGPGMRLLPIRQGGAFEADSDAPAATPVTTGDGTILTFDPHVWLDPGNAAAMARAVADALAKADPADATAYAANAAAFIADLETADRDIAARLAGLQARPFIVFHDAYHYFESHYGLAASGSISDVQAAAPSARRLAEIRDKIAATGAACVFREPQFDDKYVRVVIEGTAAREGVLDGLGADLAPGPAAYPQILRNLAAGLIACLGGAT